MDKVKTYDIQRGLEPRSRRLAIIGAVTKQLLVKTLQARKDLACVVMVYKVWKSAMALYLSVVRSCVLKWSINKSNIQLKTSSRVTHACETGVRSGTGLETALDYYAI